MSLKAPVSLSAKAFIFARERCQNAPIGKVGNTKISCFSFVNVFLSRGRMLRVAVVRGAGN
jgi:hypothetical protein